MKINDKIPKQQELLDNIGKIAYTLDKTYIARLNCDYFVLPFDEYYNKDSLITPSANIRALKVDRWVYDKNEKIADCFKNVLSVFAGSDSSIALAIHRTHIEVNMYFVLKNAVEAGNEYSKNNIELLSDSLCGNFPGTKVSAVKALDENLDFTKYLSIATICNVPSEKSEEYICQGIDKLLNGIIPETEDNNYFVIILAEALPPIFLREILSGYQEMATAISPFAGYQFQAGKNATETEGEMDSLSQSKGVSNSVTKTHSVNIGLHGSILNIATALPDAALSILGGGYGYSWGTTETKNENDTKTKGTNHSISLGTSENTTYTYKSYLVSDLVEKLESTIKRINESQATGLWKYSSYILSQNAKTSNNIANFLRSITQGDKSFIEPSFIQEWSHQGGRGMKPFNEVQKYVQHFCHPVFINKDRIAVTPTMNVSTTELSNIFAFPRYSVPGLPVLECARFGRTPHSLVELKYDLPLGCSYHMYQEETNNELSINKTELTKHTFITGSTGSGKSNTIYTILSELMKKHIKFLVIEPAKGEYKNVFGHLKDVKVYGTNPKKTKLLRINPFKFLPDIHVLEHLDRLVEIFNVCWPMYAAMPAILKDAMERAYISAGWDLQKSENKYDDRLFPTFADVREQIRITLNESAYSADNKGDYIGALDTRLKSLTNGINGMIFTSNDLSDKALFDENVIVDLSRVGSTETKALIMGLLVMKLQEYRMISDKQNADLSHITVLEEAHNLLKRTSTEQSADGANLLGKAVEMLANAIAEMRTYGEGFIIADQSPGLLDMSVIRNTNTKIIHRLPDLSDRELVGKAAGLNDNQIIEISKLKCGVAAISQSDWLEPVLCKINKYDIPEKDPYVTSDTDTDKNNTDQSLLEIIMKKEIYRCSDKDELNRIIDIVIISNLRTAVKCSFVDYLINYENNEIDKLHRLVYEFFDAKKAIELSKNNTEIKNWAISVAENLTPSLIKEGYNKQQINLVLALIVQEQLKRDVSYDDLMRRFSEFYQTKGGML